MSTIRIIEDQNWVELGLPIEVPRTWVERLFTFPWNPLKATKTIRPLRPKKDALAMPGGVLVMHPEMAEQFKKEVAAAGGTFTSEYKTSYKADAPLPRRSRL